MAAEFNECSLQPTDCCANHGCVMSEFPIKLFVQHSFKDFKFNELRGPIFIWLPTPVDRMCLYYRVATCLVPSRLHVAHGSARGKRG